MTNMVKNMRIVCFAYLIKQRCLPAGLLTVRCRPTSCISDNTYITRHYSGPGRGITKLRLVASRCLLDLQPHHFSKNNSPQLLTCVSRLASEARSEINIDNLSHELFIEGWFQEVSPFGSLTIHDVPFDIYIQPLSLTEHPQMNKSIVKMFYDARCDSKGDEVISGRKLSELSRLCEMNVTVTNEGQQMNIACKLPPGVELPVVCIVFVPIKFGISVTGRKRHDVTISMLQSDTIHIIMEKGNCFLQNVKCGTLTAHCTHGNFISKGYLLGDIQIHCGNTGSINGERFQAGTVVCSTEKGEININALYAENSEFTSQSGNISLGGCHGSVSAKTENGNIKIDSLDGSLNAELNTGSADVFIAREGGIDITTKQGDITLQLSENIRCNLDLTADKIEQDGALSLTLDKQGKGFLNSVSVTSVRAKAETGKISVKKQDWLSTVKLQFSA